MASRRLSNGRSPLVRKQSQITAFFSSPKSASPASSNPRANPSPPSQPKQQKKPPLVIPSSASPLVNPRTPPVAATGKPKPSSPTMEAVIGKRLRVFWPLDDAWYKGEVKSYDESTGKHLVKYDDGEEEDVELAQERVEWIDVEQQQEEEEEEESERPRKLRRLRRVSTSIFEEGEKETGNSKGISDSSDHKEWKHDEMEEEEEEVFGSRKKDSSSSSLKRPTKESTMSLSVKRKKIDVATKFECAKKFSFEDDKEKKEAGVVAKEKERERVLDVVNTALTGEAAERFGRRDAEKFKFLGT